VRVKYPPHIMGDPMMFEKEETNHSRLVVMRNYGEFILSVLFCLSVCMSVCVCLCVSLCVSMCVFVMYFSFC
jgi:hypothetical protein